MKRTWVAAILLPVLLMFLLIACFWWNKPPQMGANEDVFRTVDALFTAITAHDEKLLSQCEEYLKQHFASGKLPKAAATYLNDIIAQARTGKWQPAAETLYSFMITQRREGESKLKADNRSKQKT